MIKLLWARALLPIGLALVATSTLIGLSLRAFYDVIQMTSFVAVVMPLSILGTLLGYLLAIVGAFGWTSTKASRSLKRVGAVCLLIAALSLLVASRTRFGFDDERVLFAMVTVFTFFLVGVVLVLRGKPSM